MANIAIIEDNEDYRKILRMILENSGNIQIVFEADNCIDILSLSKSPAVLTRNF